MRIIGGQFKGHRFSPPRKTPARPTTDIAKEGLFNIINNNFDFEEINFLDLFGGTGSISYEFASRGCKDITLVEIDRGNINFIKQMSEKLDLPIETCRIDVFKYIKTCDRQFDLIFAGPPYPLKTLPTIPDKVLEFNLLKDEGVLIMEHNPNHDFSKHKNFIHSRNYGSTIFAFFRSNKLKDQSEKAVES